MNPCYLPLFYSGRATPYPADLDSINWWAGSNPATKDGNEVVDLIDPANVSAALYKGANCLLFTGTETITVPHLVGTETILSSDGTGTPSIVAGAINCTAGTLANVLVDDGTYLTLAHGAGVPTADSGNGNNPTATDAAWSTYDPATGDKIGNLQAGHTPSVYFEDAIAQKLTLPDVFDGTEDFALSCTITVDTKIASNRNIWNYGYTPGFMLREVGAIDTVSLQLYSAGALLGTAVGWERTTPAELRLTYDSTGNTFSTEYRYCCSEDWVMMHDSLDAGLVDWNQVLEFGNRTADSFAGYVFGLATPLTDMVPLAGGRFLDRVNNEVYSNAGTGTLVTRYSSALQKIVDGVAVAMKTKSVATFEATASLTNASIVPTDNYTVNGTAVPTVGTGEITFTAGTVEQLLLDGVVVADFTVQLGKTVDTVGGYAISVGAGGLDYFWGVRFEDEDGDYVDADNYLLLAWEGGYHNNNCEVFVEHSDAIVLGYDNLYATTGAANQIYYEDYILHVPYEDSVVQQYKPNGGSAGGCLVNEVVLYEDGYVVTPESFTKTEPWRTKYGSGCGVQPVAVTYNGVVVSYNGDIVTYSE